MGRLPGWLTFVLGGFEGPGLGGQVTLFDRPGPVLLVMALPLVSTPACGASGRVTDHPALGLDETVHQRVRLGILTVLSEAEATFTALRDQLSLSAATSAGTCASWRTPGCWRCTRDTRGAGRARGCG